MPYEIRKDGERFCVHKIADGENMGCHDTREEAESQMQALYANEKAAPEMHIDMMEDDGKERHCIIKDGKKVKCYDSHEEAMSAMEAMMGGMMGGKSSRKHEYKSFPLKAADVKLNDNTFRGIGAFMGNVDYGEDVIAPGAFSKALPEFLKSGFVPIGHDWYEKPVAMPTAAEEDGNKLIIEAEFHSTPSAQEARTIVKERLAKNLNVGLSIGFDIESAQKFEDGEKMLEWAGDNGYDLKYFDQSGIKAHKVKWALRLITKVRRLFEVSIVSVPMNPLAVATAAKVLATEDFKKLTKLQDFEEFLRDAGFSRLAATHFVSSYKAAFQRDAVQAETNAKTDETPVEVEEPVTTKRPILFTRDGRRIL